MYCFHVAHSGLQSAITLLSHDNVVLYIISHSACEVKLLNHNSACEVKLLNHSAYDVKLRKH